MIVDAAWRHAENTEVIGRLLSVVRVGADSEPLALSGQFGARVARA
jgi:hypothetical protein